MPNIEKAKEVQDAITAGGSTDPAALAWLLATLEERLAALESAHTPSRPESKATYAFALQESEDSFCYLDKGTIVTLRVVDRQEVSERVLALARAIGGVVDALDAGSHENASSAVGNLGYRLVGLMPSERVAAIRIVRMGYGLARASTEDAPPKEDTNAT